VVDLQFDPVKLSKPVLRSAREERAEDGDQLLLFPELAEAPPQPQTEVTPMRPDQPPSGHWAQIAQLRMQSLTVSRATKGY